MCAKSCVLCWQCTEEDCRGFAPTQHAHVDKKRTAPPGGAAGTLAADPLAAVRTAAGKRSASGVSSVASSVGTQQRASTRRRPAHARGTKRRHGRCTQRPDETGAAVGGRYAVAVWIAARGCGERARADLHAHVDKTAGVAVASPRGEEEMRGAGGRCSGQLWPARRAAEKLFIAPETRDLVQLGLQGRRCAADRRESPKGTPVSSLAPPPASQSLLTGSPRGCRLHSRR